MQQKGYYKRKCPISLLQSILPEAILNASCNLGRIPVITKPRRAYHNSLSVLSHRVWLFCLRSHSAPATFSKRRQLPGCVHGTRRSSHHHCP